MHEVYMIHVKLVQYAIGFFNLQDNYSNTSNQNKDMDDLAGLSCHGGHQGHKYPSFNFLLLKKSRRTVVHALFLEKNNCFLL